MGVRLACILTVVVGSTSAPAKLFDEECREILELTRHMNGAQFLQEAVEQGVPAGPQTDEFLERRLRLSYLDNMFDERKTHDALLARIVDRYLTELRDTVEDRESAWERTKKQMMIEEWGAEPDPELVRHFFPPLLQLPRAPTRDQLTAISWLSRSGRDLAWYRLVVSTAMAKVPLTTTLSKAPEAALAKQIDTAEAQVEARWKPWWKDAEGNPVDMTPETNARLIGMANEYRDAPWLPASARREIDAHLDFMRKYSIPPNRIFNDFVISLLLYEETFGRGN